MRDGTTIIPNGVNLHVEVHGPDDAYPVVLLHGWPDSVRCWDRVVPILAERYRVIAYDQRGFGRSDMPEDVAEYRISRSVGDLAGVLTWAGAERATVVGHDFGGAVAWSAAAALADRRDAVVVLASPHPGRMREVTGTDVRQLRNGFYSWLMQTEEGLDLLIRDEGRLIGRFAFAGALAPEDVEAYRAEWLDPPERIRRMANWYRAAYSPLVMNPDTPIDPPRCSIPARYVHGAKDWAFVPDLATGSGEWVDAEYDEVLLPDAPHWMPQVEPDEVARLITDWVERHREPEGLW
jgi:pimeloyl-ACP methyl ester carboxylesterase